MESLFPGAVYKVFSDFTERILYSFTANLTEKHRIYPTSNKKAIYVIVTTKAIPGEISETQLQVMK